MGYLLYMEMFYKKVMVSWSTISTIPGSIWTLKPHGSHGNQSCRLCAIKHSISTTGKDTPSFLFHRGTMVIISR